MVEGIERKNLKYALEFTDKVRDYKTLRQYMYETILGNKRSPVCGFEEDERGIENTDNQWWKEGDPRYELLKKINTVFVTLNAEEGEGPEVF